MTFLAELTAALGPDQVSTAPAARRAASTDWAHMSPVLSALLPAGLADVVARPTTVGGISAAVAIAHRHRVPVTPRGKGTGNYGQAIPLRDGLVLDTTRCHRVLAVGDGCLQAEAGTTFVAAEAAARATGQELAMFPSTVGSTLGGFLAGGAGGTGSIENGWLWSGFATSLDVVGCDDAGTVTTTTDVAPFLHAYGTTGVIARATVALRPRRDWTAVFCSATTFTEAVAAGRALMAMDPPPRLVSVDEPGIVARLPADPALLPDRYSVRAIVDAAAVDLVGALVGPARVEEVRPGGPALLTSLSFNHATYRVQKVVPGLAHLQVGAPALTERIEEVRALAPDALVHLDGLDDGTGRGFAGLLLTRYTGRDDLYLLMDRLRELGVHVSDPHTWELDPTPQQRAAAGRFDPDGLLNPGKLRR